MFSEIRGLGLAIAWLYAATEFAGKAKLIAREAAKAGVMVLIAGGDVVRFASVKCERRGEIPGFDCFAPRRANAFRREAHHAGDSSCRTCGYRRADAACRQTGG